MLKEMAALTPKSYGGMSYDRLGIDGLQWPCPATKHPGTPYLHKGDFDRSKGRSHANEYQDPAEMPDKEYPFYLTTGRILAHFDTGTMTRVPRHLDTEQKNGFVEINPQDAEKIDIEEGELVALSSRRTAIEAPERLSASGKPGVLFVPIHFGENPAKVLSNPACDPVAKIPGFNASAVNIEKLSTNQVKMEVKLK
jgi:predicted molibdopterin-dependent oxidoreductase YjgC